MVNEPTSPVFDFPVPESPVIPISAPGRSSISPTSPKEYCNSEHIAYIIGHVKQVFWLAKPRVFGLCALNFL